MKKKGTIVIVAILVVVIFNSLGKEEEPETETRENAGTEEYAENRETAYEEEYEQEGENVYGEEHIQNESKQSDADLQQGTQEEIDYSEFANWPSYSSGYAKYYMGKYGIQIYSAGEDVAEKLEKMLSSMSEMPEYYIKKSGGWFKKEQYENTSQMTELRYRGEMKNNYPDGFGMLYIIGGGSLQKDENTGSYILQVSDWVSEPENVCFSVLYAGYFKEGRFEGNGIRYRAYNEWDNGGGGCPEIVIDQAVYDIFQGNIQLLAFMTGTPIIYTGEFSEGEYCGKGTWFDYCFMDVGGGADYMYSILTGNEADAENNCSRELWIHTGEFKKGKENGAIKEYVLGHLYYDGMKKNGQKSGNGKSYFVNSTKVQYEGGFAYDVYHGTGTLYDAEGNIIYSGKWDNGDYAH